MRSKRTVPHIVFIGHEASVSGAPVALLNLLLLLQRKRIARITLVMSRGGDFLPAYLQHFPVVVLKPAGYGTHKSMFKRLREIGRNRLQLIKLLLTVRSCDIVFSNTIVNGKLLKQLSLFKKPVVSYVHELKNVIRSLMESGDATEAIQHSKVFAYPSQKVKDTLHTEYIIPENQLCRLSYYFPVDDTLANDTVRNAFVRAFKEKYQLTGSGMLVGGMGLASDRKGIDLFINVCSEVVKVDRNIRFCWIGAFENKETEVAVKKHIKEKNISENIIFTGEMKHDYNNLAAFDLFFLSSREDPYPLVVLEAALVKVPALCFDSSGGIPEFVSTDAGWVIPELQQETAARTITMLCNEKALLKEKGENAYRKCLLLHGDEQVALNQFKEIMDSLQMS